MTAEPTKGKRKIIRRLCFVVISGILIVAAVLICSYPNSSSIDEQLAAIEAARAIPDSENAVILYEKLFNDPKAGSLDYHPEFPDRDSANVTLFEPWSTTDYPQRAAWIKEQQWLIDKLLNVSEFEKCRFPLVVESYGSIQMKRISMMRKWAFLLRQAANNDIGEGRINDAIIKWQCLIQIGKHLRQQSQIIENLGGMAIESMGIIRTISFLAECNASENHLRKIEAFQVQTHDNWPAVLDRIRPVEEIGNQIYKRKLSLFDRLKYKFGFGLLASRNDPYQILHEIYYRTLVNKRGMHIMVALKRYKNKHGHWPASLEDIRSQVEPEVLVDPFNKGDFVYKLTEDSFTLYSKGENGIDDGGFRSTVSGSNSKLPKSTADDLLLWPAKRSTKSEDIR